jgi:hypothetical protein
MFGVSVATTWNLGPLRAAIEKGHYVGAKETGGVAKSLCQWAHVRRMISVTVAGHSALMRSAHKHTRWLERGTGRHMIAPIGGGRQAMKGAGYGHPVSKAIRHPGTKGHPFMGPAALAYPRLFGANVRF